MARVLIVDDSKTSRKFLRNMISTKHEVIDEAVNGQEGFDKYKELKPDVVTMDITMPIIDGIEALSLIREYDPQAKVIMVTAAGQKNNLVEAIKRGATDFIQKPFEQEKIVEVIDKAMS